MIWRRLRIIVMKKKSRPCGGGWEEDVKNSELYLGLGIGMAVGVLSGVLMRPKKPSMKSAVARVIGDVADSVSKNMSW